MAATVPNHAAYERVLYRRLRRARRHTKDVEEQKRITTLLEDPEKFGLFAEEVLAEAGLCEDTLDIAFYATSNADELKGSFRDKLVEFFHWLTEHWGDIAKIISTLLILLDEPKQAGAVKRIK